MIHQRIDGDRYDTNLGDVGDERPELVEPVVELLPPPPLRHQVLALLPPHLELVPLQFTFQFMQTEIPEVRGTS